MCVCIYTYDNAHMCVCIYTCTHVHIHTVHNTVIYTYTHKHVHIHTDTTHIAMWNVSIAIPVGISDYKNSWTR